MRVLPLPAATLPQCHSATAATKYIDVSYFLLYLVEYIAYQYTALYFMITLYTLSLYFGVIELARTRAHSNSTLTYGSS